MQARPRGVGKHVEDIKFRPFGVDVGVVYLVVFPEALPARFYLFMIVLHDGVMV